MARREKQRWLRLTAAPGAKVRDPCFCELTHRLLRILLEALSRERSGLARR
jgi:hypothetical protein